MHDLNAVEYDRLLAEAEAVKKHEAVRVQTLPLCDMCKGFTTKAHYDCKTTDGPWGYLCEKHFRSNGMGLGLGLGQRLILED